MTSEFERSKVKGMSPARRLGAVLAVACVLFSPAAARANDAVLEWNTIAVTVTTSQGPFVQARLLSITQLAVFEAVNAITETYEPYLGTIVAHPRASPDAAAIAAAHAVLMNYLGGNATAAATLDAARASSLAAIRDGSAKTRGIAVGEAAAAAMITSRLGDGSSPPEFYMPESVDPGVWQLTPSCPGAGGVLLHWRNVTTFGIRSADRFILDPPPSITSGRYAKDYNEVKRVGGIGSTERLADRTLVAQFYAASSPGLALNTAARQVSVAQGRSLSHNARALALLNMAINDSLIVSFATKYTHNYWRPETAIRAGDTDGNPRTEADTTFRPFIATPCFPSYPSNHASGTYGGIEVLERIYGTGRHAITLANPAMPGVALQYTRFKGIGADVDDARVYGGIHFRFDQEDGARLGREVGAAVYRSNLERDHRRDHDREDDCNDHHR
jgi:hypothetical protein